jgi:RND family efflux transporter MFP subunit
MNDETSDKSSLELNEQSPRRPFNTTPDPNRRNLIIGIAAVALVLIALALLVVWRWRKSASSEEQTVIPTVSVKVAKAEQQPIATHVTAVGTIFPREKADVAAKISAQIKTMALLKNKVVKAGEVIAILESKDLRAQRAEAVAALNEANVNERNIRTGTIPQTNAQDQKALRDARANLANARATYERRRTLYERGGISLKELEASHLALQTAENDLDLAEKTAILRTKSLNPNDLALAAARVQQAQQRVATLDAQLSYATIRAPITGVITDQFQYEGEFASAGGKLVSIADISQVIVKAPFADQVAAQLKTGDTAKVLLTDQPGEEMNGQVTLISRATDPTSRTVEVWVTLGNGAGQLRANGAAQVTISSDSKDDALVVPASAVTLDASNGDEGVVMVVDDKSVAHETKVKVGLRDADKLEITAGLKTGDTIVIEGNFSLADGTKVEVAKDEEKKSGEEGKE